MTNTLMHFFASADYLLALPLILLALFVGGILLIDTLLPPEWKWVNGGTALLGLGFAGLGLTRTFAGGVRPNHGFVMLQGFGRTFVFDRVALGMDGAVLVAAALAILIALRRTRREGETRGKFCALMLMAVVSLMALASAHDMVLLLASLQLLVICLSLMVGVSTAGSEGSETWRAVGPDMSPALEFRRSTP